MFSFFNFNSLHEFNDYFCNEKSCVTFLEVSRWKDGVTCPHCGCDNILRVKTRSRRVDLIGTNSYRCAGQCGRPFSVTVGSIFENTKLSLRVWFLAIYMVTVDRKGISSVNLSEKLGVTQKTAWFMLQRIREMFADTSEEKMKGEIQADELYNGGLNKNRHDDKKRPGGQGGSGKIPIVGLIEKDGRVKTFVVAETNKLVIGDIIKDNVVKGAVLITDEKNIYGGLSKDYKREKVNHRSRTFVNKSGYTTNNIENYWSIFKRGVLGIYHQVSPWHLQRYCDEFSYRYNHRNNTVAYKFNMAIQAATSARITYRELVGR